MHLQPHRYGAARDLGGIFMKLDKILLTDPSSKIAPPTLVSYF